MRTTVIGLAALVLLACVFTTMVRGEEGSIEAWGYNGHGESNVPLPNAGFVAVAAGGFHSLGLKADGTIVAWGWNSEHQCNVPAPNAAFTSITGGLWHSLALRADGSIAAWGNNDEGQCNVPDPNAGFIAVAADGYHSLALNRYPYGACCHRDGTCTIIREQACESPDIYRGDGTLCQPNPCPATGACCEADGSCEVIIEPACTSPAIWQGVGTACNPNPCLMGACCLYVTCEIYSPENCASHGGVYMGNGTLCEPNPCVSGVEESSQATALSLTAIPNPSTGQVVIRYSLPKPTTVSIEVFDAAGALVRGFDEGQRPAGACSAPWDGRDDNGRELPMGVYFARVVTGQGSAMGRAVIAR